MDSSHDVRKAKWIFRGIAFFFVSGCMSYGELTYLIWGRETQATITKTFITNTTRTPRLSVEYTFQEPDGLQRRGCFDCSPDWQVPANKKIQIRYTPGENGDSRRAGHVPWFWIIAFFGSILTMIVVIMVLGREARDLKPQSQSRR